MRVAIKRGRGARVLLAVALLGMSATVPAQPLGSAPVRSDQKSRAWVAEGVVEAVRHSDMAAQVMGTVTLLAVKAGDKVRAGQVLVRVDARAAEQGVTASNAQAEAARATYDAANKEYLRQQQLFQKQYISQAALDRAESQFKALRAQSNAQLAVAAAAHTQSSFFNLVAPYDGVVADVQVSVGDMAMPGRPLLSVYDPAALRVTATVPQARVDAIRSGQGVLAELPGMPPGRQELVPTHVTVLPTADAATHTVQVRLDLPANVAGVTPGMFARALIPTLATLATQGTDAAHLYVPSRAVFRRTELTAVYIIDAQGRAALRQIKAGPVLGDETEILAGVAADERVALDPLAAARSTAPAVDAR